MFIGEQHLYSWTLTMHKNEIVILAQSQWLSFFFDPLSRETLLSMVFYRWWRASHLSQEVRMALDETLYMYCLGDDMLTTWTSNNGRIASRRTALLYRSTFLKIN